MKKFAFNLHFPAFIFISMGNFWIWRIFGTNILIFITLLISSFLAYATALRLTPVRYLSLIASLIILGTLQYKTTETEPLTTIDNYTRMLIDNNKKAYPPVYIKFLTKTKWIPASTYLEEESYTLAIRRIEENLFVNLDLGLFFFANHPRERTGMTEYEKFPYLFTPFFIIGFIGLLKSKRYLLTISLSLPLLFLALIGDNNNLGPFVLFPLFVTALVVGLSSGYNFLKTINLSFLGSSVFLFLYLTVVIQLLLYN